MNYQRLAIHLFAALVFSIGQSESASASTSPLAVGGRGWSETAVNLVVRIFPTTRKMTVHGEATLTLTTASERDVTFWVNYGRYSKIAVMQFVAIRGPEGS